MYIKYNRDRSSCNARISYGNKFSFNFFSYHKTRTISSAMFWHFLLFPTMFSTCLKTNFNFSVTFILSSANTLKLDWSEN